MVFAKFVERNLNITQKLKQANIVLRNAPTQLQKNLKNALGVVNLFIQMIVELNAVACPALDFYAKNKSVILNTWQGSNAFDFLTFSIGDLKKRKVTRRQGALFIPKIS